MIFPVWGKQSKKYLQVICFSSFIHLATINGKVTSRWFIHFDITLSGLDVCAGFLQLYAYANIRKKQTRSVTVIFNI